MKHRIAVLAAALGAAFAAPAFASDPETVLRQLYGQPSVAFGAPGAEGLYASDLAGALRARATRSPVDFDYRYGAREAEISGFMLIPQVDDDTAKVVAVFKNFGRPQSVDWSLCRTPSGDWRIADASSNTGSAPWDLRQILGLRPDQVAC